MATLREQNLKLEGILKRNQRPRCYITDPYEKFWPLLDSEKSKVLVSVMEKTISKENGKLKVNWFTLKKLPLDVRKCQIKELSNKHKIIKPYLKSQRIVLKMGINEVSRYIEKDQIACCLIAEDSSNCMISKHLLLMTAAKKIPVIILPDMRAVMKRIIGFPSATLGLKNDIINKKDSSLYLLYQTIVQLSKQFKNPYLKQIIKKELEIVENPIRLNVNNENYLLKRPREGRAYIPRGMPNMGNLNDLSFIPIEKMIVENKKLIEQGKVSSEKSTSTDLFDVDKKPLYVEDIGESVARKTKTFRESLRYHGLKMKRMKPNIKRKLEENVIKIKE